jgi:DivIVA domain-containing protein
MILLYLVVLILVAIVLFGVGSVLFGRGERLPPLPRATTATVLPASGVTGADVDAVKFTQTLRGYKTSEVDWVLDRLGQELDSLRGELSAVYAAYGLPAPSAQDHPEGAHALPEERSALPEERSAVHAGLPGADAAVVDDRPEGGPSQPDDGSGA